MNSYPEYVESNSYWFDKVPSHWNKTRNKFVFISEKEVVGNQWGEYDLLTMGKGGVRIRDLDGGGKFPESFENYQVVKPDQLVFCLFDLDETPRTVGLSSNHGMITSAYDVFSTNVDVDSRFINYFYQSIDDVKGLRPYYTGLRKVVRSETFGGITIYIPPLYEQILISKFLDKKTSQIDSLIEKTQRKILLLKEERTVLINQCVTKGLDPNVEMKDSGIEWIGEIPKHWEVKKLKYFFELKTGSDPKLIYIDDGKYQVLGTGGVIGQTNHYMYDKPSLILGRKGTIDRPFLTTEPFWISDVVYYTVPTGYVNVIYLNFLFILVRFDYFVYGSTLPSMGKRDYENMYFPIPPLNELYEISENLRIKLISFDNHIILQNKKINLLKEYRQSLISNVVTGKVRVTEDMI